MLRSFVTTMFVIVTLGLVMSAGVSAEEIILKKEILQGWKYSTDSGDTYQEVGVSGSTLRQLMSGSSRADYEMEQYANKKQISVITGYIGTGFLGLLLVSVVVEPWDDDYRWFIMGAVGTGLVSTIYGTSARNHLREAVRVHNRDRDKGISVEVCLQPVVAYNAVGASTLLRFRF